jgi:tetratricopeptide (TPR) repeat protein
MTHPWEGTEEDARAHGLALLTRLAQRNESGARLLEARLSGRLAALIDVALEVAVGTGPPLGAILSRRFAAEGSDELAEWLAVRLSDEPYASVWPLHELALLATRRFLDRCRAEWTAPGPREQEVLAALTHNHGRRLLALGRAAEALAFLEEAAALYRRLGAEKRSQQIQCLGSSCEALSQLGRLSEALALAGEAVAASRLATGSLETQGPEEAHLALAGHLINLCGCLADVDRHADALAVIEEAVGLYRRHRRVGHAQAFARALLCRGNELHHLGHLQEAAESLEEAIALARDLETDRTTAFEPDLALALADLSLLQERLGHIDAARRALDEAIERFRRLDDRYAESFRPSLAWSLSLLSPDERQEPASLKARTEAVEHYRRLAAAQPAVHEPLLGRSLFDLGETLFAAAEHRAALRAVDEAVARLRRASPNRRDLAWALLLRGRVRGALGHQRRALADTREAVAQFRRRPARQAAFYAIDLAVALHELGIRHHHLGRFDQAIAAAREAEAIDRELVAAAPQAYLEDLASCLNALGHHLYEAGEVEASIRATRKSIRLFRQLPVERPGIALGLAASLFTLAPRLSELGRSRRALAPAAEAVDLVRREKGPSDWLAAALHALGTVLVDLQRPARALPHLEEAVALRRRLATAQPKVHDVDLASSLVNLGHCLSDQGKYREALAFTREGARLLSRALKPGNEFLGPRLAMALSNQAHQLRELGETEAALASAVEAVEVLKPFFARQPDRFLDWAAAAVYQLLAATEAAGREPDFDAVVEIIAILARETNGAPPTRPQRSQGAPAASSTRKARRPGATSTPASRADSR